jgi:tetratricopeptide (TPR) repeat protein
MEQTLIHCIHYSLQNFLYENATFMAERLFAQEKSDSAKYLLASCYYRAGKFYKVYALLKSSTSERNRYLLALAAVKMEKYRDAEIALTGDCLSASDDFDNIPNGAAGLFLLGQISRKQDQLQRAKICFQKCLSLCPFLWSAYENLCEIGGDVEPEYIFGSEVADMDSLDMDEVNGEDFIQTAVKLTQQQQYQQLDQIAQQQMKKNVLKPLPLQDAREPSLPKAPKQVKTKTCLPHTTSPALAQKLFKQTPLPSEQDGIPSVHNSPGNFALNTINFKSSPFHSSYREDYGDQQNFSSRLQGVKGKRKRANFSNEKPPFISKNLFDDNHQYDSHSNDNTPDSSLNTQDQHPRFNQDVMTPSFLTSNSINSNNVNSDWLKQPNFNISNSFVTKELPASAYKANSNIINSNSFNFNSTNTNTHVPQKAANFGLFSPTPSNTPSFTSNRNVIINNNNLNNTTKSTNTSPSIPFTPTVSSSSNALLPTTPQTITPESKGTIPFNLQGGATMHVDPLQSPNENQNRDSDFIIEGEDDLGAQLEDIDDDFEQHTEESNLIINSATQVLCLLRTIGKGYHLMCKYDSQEAILEFEKLPKCQYETGYVLCKVGKCYFEIVKYHQAKKIFEQVRLLEPYRTEDMELFSTILWQLHETVQLSYLAQQLVELDKHSPSTWCTVGNCFSLQKDHESALKFFKRAIQVKPDFAYAYTLCGHEQVSSDNWDKALAFFRNAIRIDSRHYNAWYGLGMIYFRQEKYSIAEYHFNKALAINSKNSVLYCYIGMVLRSSKRYDEAEIMLKHAIKIDPSNALAKYKKAAVLVNLGKLDSALEELVALKDYSPKEPQLFFLIGKIYKRMGALDKALYHFTLAMDFDTKDFLTRSIKQAISKLNIPDSEGGDVEATEKDTEELDEFK